MERKKLLILIGVGLLALILISILVVGIVDGIWPWDGPKAYAKIFQAEEETPAVTQPAPETEPTEEEEPAGETDSAGNQEGESTQPTEKNPVIDGEPIKGDNNVKEEVETGTNGNGNSGEGGSTEATTDNQDPNADANLSGSQVPGWGN